MKKILSFLLVAVMLFSAVACTKNNGKKPAESTPEGTTTEKGVYVSSSVDDPDEPDGILIANEGTSKYVIVRGANASLSEVTAATELQSYLKQIANVELPIVTDDTAEAKYEIVVGKTNREEAGEFDRAELGDDGFVIKASGKKLYLVGGEQRGTLYSVYSFLEEYLGCRYYTADFEKIPTTSTILLDENMPEDKQIPQFFWRDTRPINSAVFGAKLKFNAWSIPVDQNYGGRIEGTISHNILNLISPSVYYESHPEYFAGPGYTNPCFTNPEVLQIVIEACRTQLKNNPQLKFMGLGQSDTSQHCNCAECTRVLEEENGRRSGLYFRFVNAVATALKDEFPDIYFTAFAYSDTYYAPTTDTKPVDNVIVTYCTMGACWSHPLRNDVTNVCTPHIVEPGWSRPTNEVNLPAWDAISENIIVWDYATNFDNYGAFFPNIAVLRDNIRFFAEHGVVGVFEQSGSGQNSIDLIELRTYLISKLLWDPYMTEEEYYAHMNDFLAGYYGPGWEAIREYIDMVERKTEGTCFTLYEDYEKESLYFSTTFNEVNPKGSYPSDLTADMIRNYEQTDWTKYLNWYSDVTDDEYFTVGRDCMARALAAAENDDQKYRIEKLSLQIDYIDSSRKHLQLKTKTAFSKIVTAFFEANPNAFTADEQATLKNAINTFARAQIEQAYIDYNKTLRENLLKFGITMIREQRGDITNIDAIDFSSQPCNWIK